MTRKFGLVHMVHMDQKLKSLGICNQKGQLKSIWTDWTAPVPRQRRCGPWTAPGSDLEVIPSHRLLRHTPRSSAFIHTAAKSRGFPWSLEAHQAGGMPPRPDIAPPTLEEMRQAAPWLWVNCRNPAVSLWCASLSIGCQAATLIACRHFLT